ncbi:hypothetical protein [Alkalibacillus salilacus]|uniref:F0F1-type ATP synthase membrane subunit b/b n=1 Tax=Alkalibacillus salilacus TaxID=284582 RepID=A0ABT9VGA7_9BACI|nr:hypothetical protein [Alkalibacillus salilacus]MDQ0160003.1 F0F1-type ATP synthase membrane subunit b/b' [Alkalibacillus salilacus]
MKKSVFALLIVLGLFVGILVKSILEWLNISFSANVWELIFGEPTVMSKILVFLLTVLIAFAVFFPLYKKYVN